MKTKFLMSQYLVHSQGSMHTYRIYVLEYSTPEYQVAGTCTCTGSADRGSRVKRRNSDYLLTS